MLNSEHDGSSRRTIGFGFVVLLHVGLIYGLANGLGASVIEAVKAPIIAKIIETPPEQKREEMPPPPPPVLDMAPPPFVPPPEIQINVPKQTPPKAIQAVQSKAAAPTVPTQPQTQPEVDPNRPPRHPDYPAASRRLGEEGTVVLLLYVGVDGAVLEARVDKSSGFSRLDQAAVREALKSWHFLPAKEGGKAVAGWRRFAVSFHLTE